MSKKIMPARSFLASLKSRRSTLIYTVLFIVSLVVMAACLNPAITTTQETTHVRVGFSAWTGWFPWRVAEEQGIFTTQNAAVDLKWFDGYLESISALNAGQIDANSQTLGDTISSVSRGSDLVVVLVNDNSTGNDKVIVSSEINTVDDLRGKKVAAEEGTVDHFLLLKGLAEKGLTAKDIRFIPLETKKAAAAFLAGEVDAVAVFAPFTTEALKRSGSKALFTSKDFPGAISDHLVFSRKFINDNPKEVQAVVSSWFATLDYMNANPEKAAEIMAKRAGVKLEEYKAYEGGTKIFTLEENLAAFQPGNNMTSLFYAADEMSQFLIQAGFISSKTSSSALFDDRFIKAYAAKAQKK
jgi:NitT/TauT family transport system substrate-binding protein